MTRKNVKPVRIVNLFDSNFPTQACSVANQTPKTLRYVRNRMKWEGVTLFTDGQMYSPLVDLVESTYKVGWLHEYWDLHPENYERAESVLDKFDAILTTEPSLLKKSPKFWPYVRGGTWVKQEDWAVYPKHRHIAMIVSDKTVCPGHKFRHEIVDRLAGQRYRVDVYGPSFTPIGTDKARAYRDYYFAIVVEPARRAGAFAEHLLDPIAFGTIPLYWGCPNIGQFMNAKGILSFEDWKGLAYLLEHVTPELYKTMLPAAYDNLSRLSQYAITDDWIMENILIPGFNLK